MAALQIEKDNVLKLCLKITPAKPDIGFQRWANHQLKATFGETPAAASSQLGKGRGLLQWRLLSRKGHQMLVFIASMSKLAVMPTKGMHSGVEHDELEDTKGAKCT